MSECFDGRDQKREDEKVRIQSSEEGVEPLTSDADDAPINARFDSQRDPTTTG